LVGSSEGLAQPFKRMRDNPSNPIRSLRDLQKFCGWLKAFWRVVKLWEWLKLGLRPNPYNSPRHRHKA
jgi:hypothetical protein